MCCNPKIWKMKPDYEIPRQLLPPSKPRGSLLGQSKDVKGEEGGEDHFSSSGQDSEEEGCKECGAAPKGAGGRKRISSTFDLSWSGKGQQHHEKSGQHHHHHEAHDKLQQEIARKESRKSRDESLPSATSLLELPGGRGEQKEYGPWQQSGSKILDPTELGELSAAAEAPGQQWRRKGVRIAANADYDAVDSKRHHMRIQSQERRREEGGRSERRKTGEKSKSKTKYSGQGRASTISPSFKHKAKQLKSSKEEGGSEEGDSEEGSREREQRKKEEEEYDPMYEEHMNIEHLKEADISEHGSLIRYVLCELLTKRSETLMEVSLPSFMLECRSLLEVFSDFIRPGLLVEIPLARTAEDRMLRTLKFYLAGLSKMRGFEGMSKKPLNSVKGELFRCNWKPSANRQEGNVAPPEFEGIAEDYWADDFVKQNEKARKKKVHERHGKRFSAGKEDGYNSSGLMATSDPKDVRFIAEQISRRPPISAFYAECHDSKVSLKGTIETQAKLVYGCFCNLINKVKIFSKGVITLTLENFGEEYQMTLPNNRGKNVLTDPQVDFAGFVRIICVQTGYHCVIRFPDPKRIDRFRVKAHLYARNKKDHPDHIPIYKVTGKWNGEMKVEREDSEPIVFYNARTPIEKKITYKIQKQSFYESRRLWRDVVHNIIHSNWEVAEELKRGIENQYDEKPQEAKFFRQAEKKKENKNRLEYELVVLEKPRMKKHDNPAHLKHHLRKKKQFNESVQYIEQD